MSEPAMGRLLKNIVDGWDWYYANKEGAPNVSTDVEWVLTYIGEKSKRIAELESELRALRNENATLSEMVSKSIVKRVVGDE